jgi:2-polyprenyl-3-methyl-5-hydroxy-6-metoxy-1,4-benzoquinol methylase
MQWSTCLCGGREFATVFNYREPPPGEVRFGLGSTPYSREIRRCAQCGHFLSLHDIDMRYLYSGQYVDATYGGDGLKRAFDRINALPEERSDNVGRVRRVVDFCSVHFSKMLAEGRKPSVLDVGSGLCVFLHRLSKQTGWACTALDPDSRAARHASECAGVTGVCGDFMHARDMGHFDMITFNKVLEHVSDPVGMLARARTFLSPGGLVYVELPDGEAAAVAGAGREEFFIDHHHVFSAKSFRVLATKAGFDASAIESLQEPSTKYTLRGFLTVSSSGA